MLHKHDDGNPQKEDSVVEHFGVDKPICLLRIIGGKERMIYYDCRPLQVSGCAIVSGGNT